MTRSEPQNTPLSGGLRFIAFWCWLSVAFCVAELFFGLFGLSELAISSEPDGILNILLAGLAFYVALGINARANGARLVLIVLLVSGAVGMVLFPIAFGVGTLMHDGMPEGIELFSFLILFLFVPVLLVLLYSGLLRDVLGEETRKQFLDLSKDSALLAEELLKEKKAIRIGVLFGLAGTLMNFYWREW